MTVIRVSKAGSAYALVSYVFNVEIVYAFVNETGSIRTPSRSIEQLPTAGTSGAGLIYPSKASTRSGMASVAAADSGWAKR